MADINVTEEIIDINVTEEVVTIEAPTGAYPLAYPVYSVFGRTGTVVAAEGDYSINQLSDVTLTSPANGQVLKYNGTSWVNSTDIDTGITNLNGLTALSQYFATGTSGTDFSITSNSNIHTFNLPTASATNRGLLSSADWTTFNNKQNALTNPVTGTGTTNTLPKFTGTSAIGNSNITDDGTLITLGSNSYVNGALGIGTQAGTNNTLRIAKNLTSNTTAYGVFNSNQVQSDVTAAVWQYLSQLNTQASAFTLSNFYYYGASQGTIGAGSTVTSQMGFYVASNLTGATNNYGFYSNLAAATNTWNLYMIGTANNYLAGSLFLGTTSSSFFPKLSIAGNATGGTNVFSIINAQAIQSDVTSNYQSYRSAPSTQATTFTLGALAHYQTIDVSIGAGSTVTNQYGFTVGTMTGATNNYGFYGNIAAGTGRWNLYMSGTADNYLAGNIGIGGSQLNVSSGPILTTTLTNGGSGYVDGTYTDVLSTVITGNGSYALFTVIVSGGIVTSATLTWSGTTYRAGDTVTISNTLLGGTGSGLVITVNTVDSSQLNITSTTGADITLLRNDTTLNPNDNVGSIKFITNDSTTKASGIVAEISAMGESTNGGAYLSFYTRAGVAGSSLVEAMRISGNAQVIIGANVGSNSNLRVTKTLTGATTFTNISSDGVIQSDVTSATNYYRTVAQTAAASFTTAELRHYFAQQSTIGAGSTVTNQYGFFVDSTLIGATNNFGFYGAIAAGSNRWNLYMNGSANNYIAGALGFNVASANFGNFSIRTSSNITGNASGSYGIRQDGTVQSDVTSAAYGYSNTLRTQATAFTLANYYHYDAGQATLGASSVVTNQTGFWVQSSMVGATNNYGFRGQIPAQTNAWNIYMDGTANNYMAGSLGIGATASLGVVNLRISKSITGAVSSYSILNDGTVLSGVTTLASYNRSSASTTAAAFTLTDLEHYGATQGTFGAGSTVTNQYGFRAESSLTGATNNYGFYGNLAAATGRWNLYMNGTADNYMAGNTGIGIVPTFRLQVYTASAGAVARFHSGGSDGRLSANSGVFDISSTASDLSLTAGNVERVRVKSTGQMRFVPLTSDPTGAAAGDVYYNSTTNKLKVYNGTAWETITSA